MTRAKLFLIPILLIAGAAAAADPDSWIEQTWRRPQASIAKFSKVLVVGVAHDATARRNYENKLASHLRGRGIECVTSHSLVPELDNVEDPGRVVDALLAEKVDAVITVRLAPPLKEDEQASAGWLADLGGELAVRDYVEAALADSRDAKDSGRRMVEVGLWEMVSRGRVWAARTAGYKLSKLKKRSGEITQEVIYRLRYDELL